MPAIPSRALIQLNELEEIEEKTPSAEELEIKRLKKTIARVKAQHKTLKEKLETEHQKTIAYVEYRLRLDESLDQLLKDKRARLTEQYNEGTPEYNDAFRRAEQVVKDIRFLMQDNVDEAFRSDGQQGTEVL